MIHRGGFALSEALVVVALLGILASIIVPHVSGVGAGSRTATLATELRRMRARIESFKDHHNGRLPAATGESFATFLRRMAKKTNADGDKGMEFGPYLLRLPVNPFNESATVRIDGTVAGADIAGWRFDTMTGAFQADDSPDHAMF
jgi:type II secretory pathway pseudopilin PulG